MALTQVNRGGLNTGIADSSNATFLSVDASEVITVTTGSTTTVLGLGMATQGLHYNHQTPAIIKSWNVSGVVDNAVGEYTASATTAYADINYIMTNSNNFDVNGQPDAAGGQLHSFNSSGNDVAPTTTSYRVRTDGASAASKDLKYNYTTIHGDLA